MQPKKWIVAGLAAMMLTTSGVSAALAAQSGAKVVITNPDLAQIASVKQAYSRLLDEGYGYIEVSRSMLGRAVIDAWNGAQKREVVINTTSGEIIHDVTSAYQGYPAAANMAADTGTQAATNAMNTATGAAGTAADTAGDMVSDVTGGGIPGMGN